MENSFIDRVIQVVARERDPVFLPPGKEAKPTTHQAAPLAGSPNVIGSPYGFHPTFQGSKHFRKLNRLLGLTCCGR